MARLALLLGAAAGLAAVVLRPRGANAPAPSPDARQPSPSHSKSPPLADRKWENAYLTEYYPDAPPSQTRREGGRYDRNPGSEKHPVITWEDHAADPRRFPFVTVSGDLQLRGKKVPYGARLYLEAFPTVLFRLFDTGGHFFGTGKVYHGFAKWTPGAAYKKSAGINVEGRLYRAAELIASSSTPPSQDPRWIPEPRPYTEPFDIATRYHGPQQKGLGISGTRTRYWVDFDDVIDYPAWLVVRPRAVS